MAINKTQEFLYFQNRAKHFDNIKKAKTILNDQLQSSFRYNLSNKQRKKRFIPPLQQHTIKVENQGMINRVVNIISSNRTQVQAQGNYSRYNKVQRKFRNRSPYNQQLMRTIRISNDKHKQRIQNAEPKIGSSGQWVKHFGVTLSLKKNMSRYLSSNRSKGSLHLSNQKFIPHHYLSFIDKNSLNGRSPSSIQITKQGLLNLPDIKMKKVTQITYPKNNKPLIDQSKKSLQTHSMANNNSISSIQMEKSKEQRLKEKGNKIKQNFSNLKKQRKKFKYENKNLNKSIELPLRPQLLKKYENPQQEQSLNKEGEKNQNKNIKNENYQIIINPNYGESETNVMQKQQVRKQEIIYKENSLLKRQQ